jgi:hypothetical protein
MHPHLIWLKPIVTLLALTACTSPLLIEKQEVNDRSVFVPFVGDNTTVAAGQTLAGTSPLLPATSDAQLNQPVATAPIEEYLPFIPPPVPQETLVQLGGKDVLLPADVKIDGVMVTYEPLPGQPPYYPPFLMLSRDQHTALVEGKRGLIFFGGETAQECTEAIKAFSFLIEILGVDKIMPNNPNCTDYTGPESPLPTPIAQPSP